MTDYFKCVREFHKKMGFPAPSKPTLAEAKLELRINLIIEEALEFCAAAGYNIEVGSKDEYSGKHSIKLHCVAAPNWVEMIDALCDLVYVVKGGFVEMGVHPSAFFDEVHRSNMAKVGGPKCGKTGKQLKPLGWKPPQLGTILRKVLIEYADLAAGKVGNMSSDYLNKGKSLDD